MDGPSHRVLVVEDSADIREMLRLLLAANGFDVETAGDGGEALELCGKRLPDIIVTDLRMPNLDGLDLARAVRETEADLPIVMLTAYSLDDERARAFAELPGTKALSKSQLTLLAPTLRELLDT